MNDDKWPFPWPQPLSIYDSNGPVITTIFNVYDRRFCVSPTDILTPDTGRTRYHVRCLKCGKLLHEATTKPSHYIEAHVGLYSYPGDCIT